MQFRMCLQQPQLHGLRLLEGHSLLHGGAGGCCALACLGVAELACHA